MYEYFSNRPETAVVSIVGAGGIGSHFCRLLDKMITENQLNFRRENIQVFDFDVVEAKNTKHQDYSTVDIGVPKSTVMAIRYGFTAFVRRFNTDDVSSTNLIILCADNPAVRSEVFTAGINQGKPFIDMRSEGDMVAVFTEKLGTEKLVATLGKDAHKEEGVSCQLASDQAENRIRMGNFMVPTMGVEVLMRAIRGESYPSQLIRSVV